MTDEAIRAEIPDFRRKLADHESNIRNLQEWTQDHSSVERRAARRTHPAHTTHRQNPDER